MLYCLLLLTVTRKFWRLVLFIAMPCHVMSIEPNRLPSKFNAADFQRSKTWEPAAVSLHTPTLHKEQHVQIVESSRGCFWYRPGQGNFTFSWWSLAVWLFFGMFVWLWHVQLTLELMQINPKMLEMFSVGKVGGAPHKAHRACYARGAGQKGNKRRWFLLPLKNVTSQNWTTKWHMGRYLFLVFHLKTVARSVGACHVTKPRPNN